MFDLTLKKLVAMIKTFSTNFYKAIDEISAHDHLALLYNSAEERSLTVNSFIEIGLKQGDYCVVITSQDVSMFLVGDDSQSYNGPNLLSKTDQINWIDRSPFQSGTLDEIQAYLYSFLQEIVAESRARGFSQVRIIDDMNWYDEKSLEFETLLAYQIESNRFFLQHQACGISLFDYHNFSPESLLKVLNTHRYIIYQKDIFTNPFYISPDRYDVVSQAERDLQSLLAGLKNLKSWESELVRTIRNLRYLVEINKVISGTTDLEKAVNEVLSNIIDHIDASAASVLIYDPVAHDFKYEACRGFLVDYHLEDTRINFDTAFLQLQDESNQSVMLPHPDDYSNSPEHLKMFLEEHFSDYFAILIASKGNVKGLLEIFLKPSQESTGTWLPFITALVGQLSNAIENAQTFEDLQQKIFELTMAYDITIARFAKAMDRGDNRISRNSQRVSEMMVRLAREMGANEGDVAHIRRGVLLQDISKLSLPEKILKKPGPLNESEWEIMHRHPQVVFDLLEDIKVLRPALEIPYCHHEHWDGSGYPRGLQGDEIPLAARQYAVVNVYNALLTDRPYRPSWDELDALAYISSQAGLKFDPDVVDAFFRMLDRQGN